MPKTAFNSVEHGFRFANAFANSVVNIPSLGINIKTYGRCGGMAFAALDHWYNRLPIPQTSSLPVDGTPLSTYISKRLDASLILNGPRNVAVAIAPDMPDLINKGVAKAMREEEFPNLKLLIDQGKPWPIALLRARNIAELTGGSNIGHQVVAYGYEVGSPDSKVLIYDNNHPNQEHTLTFSTDYDASKLEVRHSDGETWRCFFIESYTSAFPSFLETPVSSWSWLNMGKPAGVNLRAMMGAVTVMDTPTSPQRPHVFVEGTDFNLWCRYSTGTDWHWTNMGKPPVANLRAMMGAVSVMDTPASPQRPHVFVEGDDFNLWCDWLG
jgi:hypothetical protein